MIRRITSALLAFFLLMLICLYFDHAVFERTLPALLQTLMEQVEMNFTAYLQMWQW